MTQLCMSFYYAHQEQDVLRSTWRSTISAIHPDKLVVIKARAAEKTRQWYAALSVEEKKALNRQSSERRRNRKKAYTPELIERDRKRQREYVRRRRREIPQARLVSTCRSRIKRALSGRAKSGKTIELLGCNPEQLVAHIESQFKEGMSWATHGNGPGHWHVDHILPIAWFNLESEPQQAAAFHYTNLQPLWAIDNHRKGARWR